MNDLECPYCDAPLEVCHDDGFGSAEDYAHEMECDQCGKSFVFRTTISFIYTPKKADCLNGASHRFTEWRPIHGTKTETRTCQDCDERERRSIAQ